MTKLRENERYTIEITGMTHEGQGVAKIEGFTVFIDGVLPGETVEAILEKVKSSYAVGKLLRIVKQSDDRCTPFCNSYERCGGCNLQHMNYKAQLDFKTSLVKETLKRIGKLEDITVHDTIGMENALNYRNKTQFPVGWQSGKPVIGFYASRSHEIADNESCGIQDVVSDRVKELVRRFITDNKIKVYDEKTGKGLVRHILTRIGFKTGEVMVVMVINGRELPMKEDLISRLLNIFEGEESGCRDFPAESNGTLPRSTHRGHSPCMTDDEHPVTPFGSMTNAALPHGSGVPPHKSSSPSLRGKGQRGWVELKKYKIKSIMLNVNTKKTNVILGEENIRIYGEETISDYIGKYKFKISPLSFFQINPVQTDVLYRKALEYANLSGNETVFDLYCGIGTISLFLSEKAKKVYGVEVVEAAIADAKENARINGVSNTEFIAGEAEKVIPEMYGRGIRADVVVVDPPRKGCDEVLLKTIVDMQPERIVYVSCNPSTLARDLNYLSDNGYRVVEVQPVDMFPHTAHVETVALITRVKE